MVNAEDIKNKAERKFKLYLIWLLEGNEFFPLQIPSDRGSARDDFEFRKTKAAELYKNSKAVKGYGYSVQTAHTNARSRGIQTIIEKIFFGSENDYLQYIKKEKEAERFKLNVQIIKEKSTPILAAKNTSGSPDKNIDEWIKANIYLVAEKREQNYWHDLCSCAEWFFKNPQSGLFIREIPLPVHTKFIEQNKGIVFSLYCFYKNIDTSVFKKSSDVDKELGIINAESLIRFRLLDSALVVNILAQNIQSLEILLPITTFSELELKQIKNIFIIENLMVYITFPRLKNSLCIFGSGFASLRLRGCANMHSKNIFYFGDIDEHGFEILSDLRSVFSHTKSFCMDEKTYTAFCSFALTGKNSKRALGDFNLTDDELKLLKFIQKNKSSGRLEQERVSQSYIKERLCEVQTAYI